jgi:predicted DNA-binding transcriptional regulator YafY
MTETSSRLLTLLSLLQARRDWSGRELADRLEVSSRTIRRDVERLRGLGYPVESLTGPAGGYRLRAGTAMPPLLLDDDEAIAIAVGLRTAARASVTGIEETSVRALVKLEQVLPAHLRRRVRALGSATMTLPAGGPTVDPQSLTVIAAACRDSERIRFGYRGRDGVDSRREVEPHSLVNLGRRWYLVAWDRDRRDWRTFRIDRLKRPASTGVRFTPRDPPARDAAAYVAQSISAAPNRYEARVTLHAPAEAIRKRVPSRWGAVEPIDDRTCVYRTGDYDIEWLALRVVMLGVDFEVHEPPELVEQLLVLAERLGRAAGAKQPISPP